MFDFFASEDVGLFELTTKALARRLSNARKRLCILLCKRSREPKMLLPSRGPGQARRLQRLRTAVVVGFWLASGHGASRKPATTADRSRCRLLACLGPRGKQEACNNCGPQSLQASGLPRAKGQAGSLQRLRTAVVVGFWLASGQGASRRPTTTAVRRRCRLLAYPLTRDSCLHCCCVGLQAFSQVAWVVACGCLELLASDI